MCLRDRLERVDILARIALSEFTSNDRSDVLRLSQQNRISVVIRIPFSTVSSRGCTYEIEHDLAHEHILERSVRFRVVLRGKTFEGFEEVGVGGLVVLVLGVEDSGLHVELRLEEWGTVDGVGGRSS